jgi:hypothetical protein
MLDRLLVDSSGVVETENVESNEYNVRILRLSVLWLLFDPPLITLVDDGKSPLNLNEN